MHDLDDFCPCEEGSGSRLARCDVRVKLILALAAILAVVLSTRAWLPLVVLAGSLAILLAVRTPRWMLAGRLAGPATVAVLVCLLQGFMTGRTPLFTLDLGPWRLVATREGLLSGAMVGLRVLGSVSVILVLCTETAAESLFAALRWARVPRVWVEIGVLMYRYTFTLLEQAVGVASAQKIRLGYAGLWRSLGSLGSLAGIVVLRSIDQAGRTHEAMVARGYHGSLPLGALPPLARRDRWIVAVGLATIASALWVAQRCIS
jgi:cobalt/nickel transport system permease protein